MPTHNSSKNEIEIRTWKQTKRPLLRWHICTQERLEDSPSYVAIPFFFYLFIHATRAMIFNSSLKMLLPHTSDLQIVAAHSFHAEWLSHWASLQVTWYLILFSGKCIKIVQLKVKKDLKDSLACQLQQWFALFTHWEPTGDILKMTRQKLFGIGGISHYMWRKLGQLSANTFMTEAEVLLCWKKKYQLLHNP